MHAFMQWRMPLLIALGAIASVASAETFNLSYLKPQAIIGKNSLEYAEAALGTDIYEYMRVVARVENANGSGFCSGARIGHDLFMTNHHCMQACTNMQFRMGYEKQSEREQQVVFKCKQLISNAEQFDYALYRVEANPAGEHFPSATLSRAVMEIGSPLLVPGHPQTRPKQFDRSTQCQVSRKESFSSGGRINFGHTCDTEPGSSGSPVLDRSNGHIVAIHWGSVGGYNASVPMHFVIGDITSKAPDVLTELTIVD